MYGENTARLRAELATLMQVTRTDRNLQDLPDGSIELISSFRTSITVWCQQAVRASNPHAELGGTTPRTRGPAEELRFRLVQARSAYTAPLPQLEHLATPHPNHVVDMWRRAARAAVLGEQDFSSGLAYGNLTDDQAMAILKDAAEVTRALTGIDRHYATTDPSWEPIEDADLLGRAAVVCAAHAGYNKPDYSVDLRGWRPPAQLVEGPALPGLGGVLQAENNLLVHLRHQPDAYSLRLIFDSQRIVSHSAIQFCFQVASCGKFAEKWTQRAETYERLVDQSRNLRGLVGTGNAAAESALAAARIRSAKPNTTATPRVLRDLDAFFGHIDRRIATIIRAGAADRSYLMRVGIPRVDLKTPGPIKEQRTRHVPLDLPRRSQLLTTVDKRLPTPATHVPALPTPSGRAEFLGTIPNRPDVGGTNHAGVHL